ncbi:MAG TPA: exopolysaccharide biosynthesis protein, partial [Rhodanobacteraceae bacterium]|nr:exopolysaccharide biosynthesis protein [Rhodanobacteraceae bacterium]
TTELLTRAIGSQSGEKITIGEFLDPLGERAFGFLVLILAIPNFIPVPIGVGGVMGVLVIYVGAQMLLGFQHPWLLRSIRRHGMKRSRVEKFVARLTPLLRWLEHVCEPRMEVLTRQPAHRITGLLLVLVGVALALPIPFTNYVFGVLLVVYAVALIERDGVALIVAWLASVGVAVALVTLSSAAIDAMRKFL